MKYIITITLLSLFATSYAQKTYQFHPNWKKGESKKILISENTKEYKNDSLISDSTTYNESNLKVVKNLKDSVIVELVSENQALKTLNEFYALLDKEYDGFKDLNLKYSINKTTAEYNLLNWKEAQEFIFNSYDEITALMEEKSPDMLPLANLTFSPIKALLEDKSSVENYISDEIAILTSPLNRNFIIGDTITVTESAENPFNPMQEISSTTYTVLESVDEEKKSCTIYESVDLDLSEFIEMMKGFIQKMSAQFVADDSLTTDKVNEMTDFDMKVINEKQIIFNYDNSWISTFNHTVTIKGIDPRNGVRTENTVTRTVTIE